MKLVVFLLAVGLLSFLSGSATANEVDPVIQNVVDHLKQDLVIMKEYGAHQRIVTTKLSEQGTPKRVEEKTLRTIWVHNNPQNELISVTCKDYDTRTGTSRRCYDAEKAAYKKANKTKGSQPGKIETEIKKIRWTELHRHFDFSMLPADGPYHVISFRPSSRPISPKTRIEKLLSRLTGKVWVDHQFNVVKAQAKLANPVSFGLGVAAKVHHLSLNYQQQAYSSVWLPAALTVEFRAKVALVHTERQRIEVFWNGPYRQSDAIWAHASKLANPNASRKR